MDNVEDNSSSKLIIIIVIISIIIIIIIIIVVYFSFRKVSSDDKNNLAYRNQKTNLLNANNKKKIISQNTSSTSHVDAEQKNISVFNNLNKNSTNISEMTQTTTNKTLSAQVILANEAEKTRLADEAEKIRLETEKTRLANEAEKIRLEAEKARIESDKIKLDKDVEIARLENVNQQNQIELKKAAIEFKPPENLNPPWTQSLIMIPEIDFPVKVVQKSVYCIGNDNGQCLTFNELTKKYLNIDNIAHNTCDKNDTNCIKLKNIISKQLMQYFNKNGYPSTKLISCDQDNKVKNNGIYTPSNSWCEIAYDILFNKDKLISSLKSRSNKELGPWTCMQDNNSNSYGIIRKKSDGTIDCYADASDNCHKFDTEETCNAMKNHHLQSKFIQDTIIKIYDQPGVYIPSVVKPMYNKTNFTNFDDDTNWISKGLMYL